MADYQRNVVLRGGEATVRLPLALNDATGEWEIALSDLVSRFTVKRVVEVGAGM